MHKILLLLSLACTLVAQPAAAQTIVTTVSDLEAAASAAADGDIIQLDSSFPATLPSVITLNITHANSFTIDGSAIALTPATNARHFNVTKNVTKTPATGTISFKNFTLTGFRSAADIAGAAAGAPGGGITVTGNGSYLFENMRFAAISNRALSLPSGVNATVSASTFSDNFMGGHGGAILSMGALTVQDSTFIGNISNWSGYSGGAIAIFNATQGETRILRSVFLNNVSNTRGGAIAAHQAAHPITVDSSYFEGNTTTSAGSSGSLDGGAISIHSTYAVVFTLQNSTFYKNIAKDDGGAIFLESENGGSSNTITNCTMYQNSAMDVAPATSSGFNIATAGGAIQASLKTKLTLEHNTIIQNYTNSVYKRGAGIGFHASSGGTPTFTLKNNIILGNYFTASGTPETNNYANVGAQAIVSATVTNMGGNIGIDNGVALTPAGATLNTVFGNNAPVLWSNLSNIPAGNPIDNTQRIVPTVSILLNDGTILGMADNQGTTTLITHDERNAARITANPDIGAVEILWIKFDPNTGNWQNLPAPTALDYKGVFYTSTAAYYDVSFIGSVTATAALQNLTLVTTGGPVSVSLQPPSPG